MKHILQKSLCIGLLSFSIIGCRKDPVTVPVTPPSKNGTVKLEFTHVVGSENLVMNTAVYKNQNGDDYTVTKFNYYISNIKLNKADGSAFTELESYHLLEQSAPSTLNFDIANVVPGNYKSITYTIGVDSARNTAGVQSGALDPAKGMFWSWSTGYIMLKLEGTSPQSTQAGNMYQLHGGGFKGTNSVLRTITLNLPQELVVNGNENHIHISADVRKTLGGSNPINFANTSVIMSAGASAKAFADNYQNMFTVTASGQ